LSNRPFDENSKNGNYGKTPSYFNPEHQCLEHFRHPEIFLRQTKKAYISFVTPDILAISHLMQDSIPSYDATRLTCQRRGIKVDMRYCRKIFASWLHPRGIPDFVIDLLQGRCTRSVLVQHYLVPKSSIKDDVLQAIQQLKAELEK
jgi:intergrase/recombinase